MSKFPMPRSILSRNKVIQVPGLGGSPDYVEVRNTGTVPADLTGVALSGKLFEDAPRFLFPAGTILQPRETVLVYCTGLDAPFHAPFSLDPKGGSFYLLRSTQNPETEGMGFLDRVVIPELERDQAVFRLGAGGPWTTGTATPGLGNVETGKLILTTATSESGEPVLTVAIPTVVNQPWQILSSPNLSLWQAVSSGTGDGIEKSIIIETSLSRGFFRAGPSGP
jgi:hypothetical protein